MNPVPVIDPPLRPLGGVAVESPRQRTALLYSLWEGSFANVMIGLVETFGVAAAVFLEAPAMAIAMLGSLPLLLSSFGQLILPQFVNHASGRKKQVLRGTTMQSLFLILVACSGYLPEAIRAWSYVFLFALYGFCGNVVAGFWIAWMGDLVPPAVRGRHFAWRNRIFSLTQLVCALAAGVISRRYTTDNAQWILFAAIFFAAGCARIISTILLNRQYEPPVSTRTEVNRGIRPIISSSGPFLFYCIAAALVQGSTSIAGPFFNVWYIRDLHFNYLTLSMVTTATVLGTIVALPFWGRIADTFSNRTVIVITVLLIATVPLPYIISSRPWHIWVLNFYTGVCWSGYNLCNFNYLLAASGTNKSEQYISFAVAVTGIFNFVFSVIGGYLATRLPHLFHYQLHSLFLLSSIMRFIIFCLLIVRLPHFEPAPRPAMEMFNQIPGYRAGLGLLRNSFRAFRTK